MHSLPAEALAKEGTASHASRLVLYTKVYHICNERTSALILYLMDKIRVGILFGGRSAEHEVSLQSARNIINSIDKNKYELVLLGIDKEGKWHIRDAKEYLLNENDPKLIKLNKANAHHVTLVPGETAICTITNTDAKVEEEIYKDGFE